MGWFLLSYFMLHLLLFNFPFSTCSLCNLHDSSALLEFKNSFALSTTSHQTWSWLPSSSFSSKTKSWKNRTDCCKWDGVTCDTISGHVIGIDLSLSNLKGEFRPNSTLFQLTNLQQLNLAFNDLSGSSNSIYYGIGNLVNLKHLNLSSNGIDDIPSTISRFSKLVSLDLSTNWRLLGDPSYLNKRLDQTTWNKLILNATNLGELVLDGVDMSSITERSLSLLANLSSSLVSLSLRFTKLRGNFPCDILSLPNLQELRLSSNENLRGELSKSNWSAPLRYLSLSLTSFSGEIPNSIGHSKFLNHLSLSYCKFYGSIPLPLWNLSQLTYLDLSRNEFNGEIPSLLSNLRHITYFDLSFNNLSGLIPDVFGGFSKLETLILFRNNLRGYIPSSIFDLSQLSYLDLSYNKLGGLIPVKITKFSKLKHLDLSYNMLNGTIPKWCYSLPLLSTLDLSDNHLTGSISEFSTYSLEHFHLSNNNLQGNFPQSIYEFENLIELSLSSTNLSGLVKFHKFSKLQKLISLDLSQNSLLSINIDNSVDNILPNLKFLYLSSCNVKSFPKFLAGLQKLQHLDLSNNQIVGEIPKWFHEKLLLWWKSIDYVDLSFNKLHGNLPIPPKGTQFYSVSNNNITGDISSTICNASFLLVLNLAHNNLTGMIPQCLGTLPLLSVLDLQRNNLYGNLPINFTEGNSLETIKLNGNQLEGQMPQSLVHCKDLEVLDLADNSIEDTFPRWLETLQHLKVLSLRSNKFHGVITCFSNKNPFSNLRIFDVSNNNFTGPLPASCIKNFQGMVKVNDGQTRLKYMGKDNWYNESIVIIMKGQYMELKRILTIFTTIDLSNNMFEGEIPNVIGELHSLKGLNLSHNGITGTIPQSLGSLSNLEWLDLSWNKLSGEIPMELTDMYFLSFLNLSQNQFEGIIPSGRQFNTFGNDSYDGNPMLCGFPLSRSCNNVEEGSPHSILDQEESGMFGWKAVAVGYACGMVFGMLLGYNLFLTGKPQWLARLVEGVFNARVRRTNRRAHTNRRRTN